MKLSSITFMLVFVVIAMAFGMYTQHGMLYNSRLQVDQAAIEIIQLETSNSMLESRLDRAIRDNQEAGRIILELALRKDKLPAENGVSYMKEKEN
ncbi:MAG: hypothetical protein DRQ62_00075 [Gammaproteobacteria bacterium]|nr:MAG: hypothetical protein DRQ62_00075 [Gammaproteobacteria bacterium]